MVEKNMVKSNTPACVQAQVWYKGGIAPGEMCSASWRFLSFSLSQSNIFLLVQMHSRLANTSESESFKQPLLDTQLTHSLLISLYIIFFFVLFIVMYLYKREGIVWIPPRHTCLSRNSITWLKMQWCGSWHTEMQPFGVNILISYKGSNWVSESMYSNGKE